jgi:hypothetical protein
MNQTMLPVLHELQSPVADKLFTNVSISFTLFFELLHCSIAGNPFHTLKIPKFTTEMEEN